MGKMFKFNISKKLQIKVRIEIYFVFQIDSGFKDNA